MLLLVIFLGMGCQSLLPGYEYKGTVFDPPVPMPNFELMDTQGQPFQLNQTKGEVTLVYFGYTFCPDICPLTLADIKKALAELEERDKVHVVFISVDPERDTPEVLDRYVHAFDPKFIGLTGEFAKIQEVMKPFGAYAEKEPAKGSAAEYLVNHTARLYLIDPQGELLLTYSFGFKPEELRSDLAHVLQQSR
jgi:protein SCO1/2